MAVTLGHNQYGKAETRMVRVTRDGDRHELKDLNVGVTLSGDLADVHLTGDNANVVPTDTQKNTVYAFAKEAPVGEIEEFGLRLARHFVGDFEPISQARVYLEEYPWARIEVGGVPHDHAFVRASSERRTATVVARQGQAWVVSGLADLVVLKSTGSEFTGYIKDRYTTLTETTDRILATAVTARWRHGTLDVDWAKSFAETRRLLLEAFATTHSLSLQQSLYAMAESAISTRPEVVEVRMSMPNKHHFVVDLSPFGLANDNEVFHADDRPYGLIEAAVLDDGAPDPGPAWDPYPML
jgi:urate oxidase